MSYETPLVVDLEEGVYEIVMPLNILVGGINYSFDRWDDSTTDPIRTITLEGDASIEAIYSCATPDSRIFDWRG